MKYAERREKAIDLIAFLSAFGIDKFHAQEILHMARTETFNMTDGDYKTAGNQMQSFVAIMVEGKPQ